MSQFMSLSFLASIYFFARGVFALFGQTTFYTKRHLEHIDESDLPVYLKQIGIAHVAVGIVFLAKAILNVLYPYSRITLYAFLLALLVCVYFISKIDNRFKK